MNDNKYKYKFPKVVRIEPSATCNLACLHCPTGTYKNPIKGNMSKETFLKIRDEIKKHNIRVAVLYMGGEPFINRDFFFMVEELKKINIPFIKTVSNGMLLKEKIIDNIIMSGLDSIEISLDGSSATENDFIRRNCNSEKVVKNIQRLLDKKILNKSNLRVTISSTQFKRYNKNNMLESTKSDWIEKRFDKYLKSGVLNIEYGDAVRWSDMRVDKNIFDVVTDENDFESNECDHIISTITIRYNGDVVPCCYDLTSRLVMGNILDNKIEDVWNNEKYIKLRKSINEKKFYSICSNCSVVNKNRYLILKKTDNVKT